MAHIDPSALIQAYIPFIKSSESFDSERQSVMGPATKNCTVLNSPTSGKDGCEEGTKAVGNRANSGSTLENASLSPSSQSTGLHMIQTNYRDSSSSPPIRSAKRLKLTTSSTSSSSRSSSVSGISTSSIPVNIIVDAKHKINGKQQHKQSSSSSPTSEAAVQDSSSGTNIVSGKPNPLSVRMNTNSNFTNINGYDEEPSTSKAVPPDSKLLPASGLKKRMDIVSKPISSPLKSGYQNGKSERKRLLSENNEREVRPPDNRIIFYATWEGSCVLILLNFDVNDFYKPCLFFCVNCKHQKNPDGRNVGVGVKNCVTCSFAKFVRCSMSSKQPFKPSWIGYILDG
ncbi:unnamed protein product [Thelazia callipaeda]|uniref:AF4/FMR2 family member lilli n=1 Tax=Thelazia callipaeda TaxID=103827 RepID=A0A0N5CKQ9_THECL|nr:unnamed protein product [Thelazia callipaeda]